ncbi:MAG: DUF3501 family protein [Myxococcales bacterium]|nr:DUF3501 family protein [Myxococcales bacterium]
MRPVERSEILPVGEYERVRDAFRARVIAEKKLRRVALGPRMTCVFENRDTVMLQVQEMLRTERITREAAIAHELETYNELVPADGELSATLMIEIDDKAARDAFLVAARGIERAFTLGVAPLFAAGRTSAARDLEDRASAVMYVRFALPDGLAAKLRAVAAGGPASEAPLVLAVDHAAYRAEVTLPAATVASLAEDVAS